MNHNKLNKFQRWRKKWCRSGIESWWQGTPCPTSTRPLSLVTMSVTLMAASCDSIGSCSLDVDAESLTDSLADSNHHESAVNHRNAGGLDANAASLSERTLHSLLLTAGGASSTGGDLCSPCSPDNLGNVSSSTAKKPSYLNLACSISGYGGITTYDSKLREGFRSRDHSPGKLIVTDNRSREASPARTTAGCRSNCGNFLSAPNTGLTSSRRTCWTPSPVSGQPRTAVGMKHTSPTIGTMPHVNGRNNGTDQTDATGNFNVKRLSEQRNRWLESTLTTSPEKGRSYQNVISVYETNAVSGHSHVTETTIEERYKSSTRSHKTTIIGTTGASTPISSYSTSSRNERLIPITLEGKTAPRTTVHSLAAECPSRSNGAGLQHTPVSSKSFIQQRVERLYGPGALAQGFFHRSSRSPVSASPIASSGPADPGNCSADKREPPRFSLAGSPELPVLRHLRPEFREQLPVAPRRSMGTRSPNDVLQKPNDKEKQPEQLGHSPQPLQHQSSTDSLADLKLAAPEVVLPSPPKVEVKPIEKVINGCGSEIKTVSVTSIQNEVKQEAVPSVTPKAEEEVVPASDPNENAGHKFLRIKREAIEKLLLLAEWAETEIANSGKDDDVVLSEEALGHLRAAAGKARLLVTQKMVQFEGLCRKCISQRPDEQFPTTAEDLQGFWDMVMLQVDQVHCTFQRLNKLKAVGWCEEKLPVEDNRDTPDSSLPRAATTNKRTVRAKQVQSSNAKAAEAAALRKQREEDRRRLMEERRRQLKQQQKAQDAATTEDSVEIFAPQSC